MFEVGFTEIVLILGIALLVLGPEKLPGLAQKVGRWSGRARAMARQLRAQLEHEATLEELARSRPMRESEANAATTPAETEMQPSAQTDPVDLDSVAGVQLQTPKPDAPASETPQSAVSVKQ
ncbi:MAG TPA: Sec-independent protein translocase protein TatB [Steroidobacter sp.]|jgi:sec-independent protein translocase protein TatB|nr:Sec-independent protein translocase protein TatB [Steroidobacter sp.]